MKREDFKEITEEHRKTAKELIENGGRCIKIECGKCPFFLKNNIKEEICYGVYTQESLKDKKDKKNVNSAKEFLKLVENDVEKGKTPYDLIKEERKRQDKLHPEFPEWFPEQLALLMEELGEAAQAYNDDDMENCYKELVQVAALSVRMLEVKNG